MLGSLNKIHRVYTSKPNITNMVLIWDTGAPFGLTPFRSDFIDYVAADIAVKDVTKVNKVIGIGTTIHKFCDVKGVDVYLPCVSYHLPQAYVRLFSPQTYYSMHGEHSKVFVDRIEMICHKHKIVIPINKERTNLPPQLMTVGCHQKRRFYIDRNFVQLCAGQIEMTSLLPLVQSRRISLKTKGIIMMQNRSSSTTLERGLAYRKMRICRDHRKSYSCGIGSWALACTEYKS